MAPSTGKTIILIQHPITLQQKLSLVIHHEEYFKTQQNYSKYRLNKSLIASAGKINSFVKILNSMLLNELGYRSNTEMFNTCMTNYTPRTICVPCFG